MCSKAFLENDRWSWIAECPWPMGSSFHKASTGIASLEEGNLVREGCD